MTTDGGVVYAIVSNMQSSAAGVWSTGFPFYDTYKSGPVANVTGPPRLS
jgi:hypothetical protein